MTEMYLEMVRLFFILGGIVALIVGLILFFNPAMVASWSKKGDKWYSSSDWTKPLDVMRDTDSFYFKNHLPTGVTMMILSLVGFYLIATRVPGYDEVMASTVDLELGMSLGILLEGVKWFLLISIIVGFPMWGFLAFKPDSLKKINNSLNQWVSAGKALAPLEKMNHGFDNFVLNYNRFFGAVFVLGSVFILFKFLV